MVGFRQRIRFAHGRYENAIRDVSRYDLVLAVIPAVFLAAGLLGELISLPPTLTALLAGALGSLAVVDALFINPPREQSTPESPV
jgi:hypothetical protein